MFLCLCARKIWRALLILLILLSLINVSPTSGFTNYIDVATLMPNGDAVKHNNNEYFFKNTAINFSYWI